MLEQLLVFQEGLFIMELASVKKTPGLSPLENYTDRATAVCRQSYGQLLADRGCRVVSATNPHGR
jgi:hypothetical protein